jgi:glycosyltransferase involved in cell wall biosynthesis
MRGKLTTIYNGVDLEQFTATTTPLSAVKRSLKLLVLSSVVPKKNAIGLVRALADYREFYGGRCTVHWAGKLTPDSASQREFREASRLLKDFSLESQWEWLGEREDVAALLRQCDALIHPSFFEGLPNAICEALASGRPVLASDVCDNARLVQEGVTGFLFDPADPCDIARAIYKLDQLSDAKRLAMAEESRSFAEKELSLEVYSERYEKLIENLGGFGLCNL